MKWSLATQLRLGTAAVLLMLLCVTGTAWWIAFEYRGDMNIAYETYLRTTVELAEAQSALWQLRYEFPQFMVESSEEQQRILDEQDKWYSVIEARLAAYGEIASGEDERRALTNLRAAYQRYKQARPKFFELWAAGEKDEAIAWRALTTTPFGAQTVRAFETQIALQRRAAEEEQAETRREVQFVLLLVSAATVMMVATLVAGYAYAMRMLRPIHALDEQALRIVREHLGETLTESARSNEVAALEQSFRLMSERLLARNEALRKSEEGYRLLFESSRDALITLGPPSWRFTSANHAALELVGVDSAAAFTALHPLDFSPPRQPDGRSSEEKFRETMETALREGTNNFEWKCRRLDGGSFIVDILLTRMREGPDMFVLATLRDITERKRIETQLQASRDRLALATTSARIGIWDWNVVSNELVWDAQMYALYGIREQDFSGAYDAWQAGLHPDDRERGDAAIKAALNGEREFDIEFRVRWPNGEVHDIEAHALVQRAADGSPTRMIGVNWDITERKRTAALAIELESAVESDRLKSDFMANLTHELRTPLNSVIGFAELLKEEVVGPLNAKQAAFADDILAGGRRLLALVDGMLEMSRLDAAAAAIKREPVDIAAALEERMAAHREAAAARRLTMQLDVAPDTGNAKVDPRGLRRMLDALLDNAIKFNHEGGTVTASTRRAGDVLEIAVADTGIAIAREDLPRLFKPFVQIDGGLARHNAGVGLGLALVRRIAGLHGGTVDIESEPNQGSTFTVRLPAEEHL